MYPDLSMHFPVVPTEQHLLFAKAFTYFVLCFLQSNGATLFHVLRITQRRRHPSNHVACLLQSSCSWQKLHASECTIRSFLLVCLASLFYSLEAATCAMLFQGSHSLLKQYSKGYKRGHVEIEATSGDPGKQNKQSVVLVHP